MVSSLWVRNAVNKSTIDAAAKLIEKNKKWMADNLSDIDEWPVVPYEPQPAPVTQSSPNNVTTTSSTSFSASSAGIGLLSILSLCINVI